MRRDTGQIAGLGSQGYVARPRLSGTFPYHRLGGAFKPAVPENIVRQSALLSPNLERWSGAMSVTLNTTSTGHSVLARPFFVTWRN